MMCFITSVWRRPRYSLFCHLDLVETPLPIFLLNCSLLGLEAFPVGCKQRKCPSYMGQRTNHPDGIIAKFNTQRNFRAGSSWTNRVDYIIHRVRYTFDTMPPDRITSKKLSLSITAGLDHQLEERLSGKTRTSLASAYEVIFLLPFRTRRGRR